MRLPYPLLPALMLVACTGTPHDSAPHVVRLSSQSARAALDAQGEEAVRQLDAWYASTPLDCGGPDRPSLLCSGVLIRATSTHYDYLPWDPSPGAIAKGGTSFAWLRRDQTFSNILVDNYNGFLFYPPMLSPPGKLDAINALCSFPKDADTWNRPTEQGCGPYLGSEATSQTCQALGVRTAQQWLDRYQTGRPPSCGWNLRKGTGGTAEAFNASVQAHQGLPEAGNWRINNELIVSTWRSGVGADLPMRAFFYFAEPNELEARTKAWIDQIRYYQAYGQVMPIVRVALPRDKTQRVDFSYASRDQGLEPGGSVQRADFEDAPLGLRKRVASGPLDFGLHSRTGGVHDEPLPSALIQGRYASGPDAISFGVKPMGAVRVSFSWGCIGYCELAQTMSGEEHEVSEGGAPGEMRFGRLSTLACGPEHITLRGDGDEGARVIIDDVVIERLPHEAQCARAHQGKGSR